MSTINQVYPLVAGYSTDSFVPDTTLLGGEYESATFPLPSNTLFTQYEVALIDTTGTLKKWAAPAAGERVVVVCATADNLTATAAANRTAAVMCWYEGRFNELNLVYTGGATANTVRGPALPGIALEKPMTRN